MCATLTHASRNGRSRPGKVDAALDFYSDVSALIHGRIRRAESAAQLRGALADLLNGVWVKNEDTGRVSAEFSAKTPDDDDRAWRYVEFNFRGNRGRAAARAALQAEQDMFLNRTLFGGSRFPPLEVEIAG
jgi:hypothetical protein